MRVFTDKFGTLRLPEGGGYGRDLRGRWWLRLPGQDARVVPARDVVELPNDTITVSGFLTAGAWRMT